MSYLSKFLILLVFASYAGFMDYMENPERYEVVTQMMASEYATNIEKAVIKISESKVEKSDIQKAIEKRKIRDDRLSLSYNLKQYTLDDMYIEVDAKIRNHSNEDIYFHHYSCDGMKDLFEIKSDVELSVFYTILCHATFPVRDTVKANSTYKYNFMVTTKKSIEKLDLDFSFIELKADENFDRMSYYDVTEKHIKQAILLEGKPTKIQKIEGRNPRLEQLENL